MKVLGDLVGRDRRSGATALRAPAVGRCYDYHRFCTSAWKVGNFLRHLGVRSGAGVAVADDPAPESVLSFYGAALLGGVVRFDPPTDVDDGIRALVVPEADLETYDAGPATKLVAYGDEPDDPRVSYFERDVWSENPTEPPDPVSPDDPLLRTPRSTYTHRELIDAASSAAEALSLDAGTEVAVRGSFADPGVVAAGLVAPVLSGAVAVVGPDPDGDVIVDGSDATVSTGDPLDAAGSRR